MSECATCGREDGHWLGCAKAPSVKPLSTNPDHLNTGNPDECFHEGCTNLRRSDDKRVKFCEFHSDPKNRK